MQCRVFFFLTQTRKLVVLKNNNNIKKDTLVSTHLLHCQFMNVNFQLAVRQRQDDAGGLGALSPYLLRGLQMKTFFQQVIFHVTVINDVNKGWVNERRTLPALSPRACTSHPLVSHHEGASALLLSGTCSRNNKLLDALLRNKPQPVSHDFATTHVIVLRQ